MELDEVARVLAKCSAYDLRTVGRADVAAWAEIIGQVGYVDALDAVTRHYRESSERAMPADILRHSRDAKRDRLRRDGVKSAAMALPGRYEPDAIRENRNRRRAAEIRDALPKPRHKAPEPSALDLLRKLTPDVDESAWTAPAETDVA